MTSFNEFAIWTRTYCTGTRPDVDVLTTTPESVKVGVGAIAPGGVEGVGVAGDAPQPALSPAAIRPATNTTHVACWMTMSAPRQDQPVIRRLAVSVRHGRARNGFTGDV